MDRIDTTSLVKVDKIQAEKFRNKILRQIITSSKEDYELLK